MIVCSRPEDGLRCPQGVKPPFTHSLKKPALVLFKMSSPVEDVLESVSDVWKFSYFYIRIQEPWLLFTNVKEAINQHKQSRGAFHNNR